MIIYLFLIQNYKIKNEKYLFGLKGFSFAKQYKVLALTAVV